MRRLAWMATATLLMVMMAGWSSPAPAEPIGHKQLRYAQQVVLDPMDASDVSYAWEFDESQDMQLPELPTGCEATAAATLARLNGITLTKTQVADALPRSETDFVHAFIGDPYSEAGWACSAPCIANTLNKLMPAKAQASNLTGTALADLPTPCAVWATIDMTAPNAPVKTLAGYGIFRNTHCVVLLEANAETVTISDPLEGICTYAASQFTEVYDGMGRQAVHIAAK